MAFFGRRGGSRVGARAALAGALGIGVAAAAGACGGKVHIDPLGEGGAGGSGPGATVSSSSGLAQVSSSSSFSSSSSISSSSSSGIGGAPPIPPLIEVPLGQVAIGLPVSFDVAPGMLGWTAIGTGLSPFDLVGFEQAIAPDGSVLMSNYGFPNTSAGYYNYGSLSLLVPQTDAPQAMPLMPGTWQVIPGNFSGGTPQADVTVWLRQTLDGNFHGGVIDINIFTIPGVFDEGYLVDMVDDAFDEYAGLWMGTVNILPLAEEFYEVDDDNFFLALESTAGAPGKPALNILAVGFLGGSIEGAAGVTPGAPSNPLEHGTHQSGFFWMVQQDGFFDETILRHEAGHLAGLFHTSEFEAGLGDALGDTPLCPNVEEQFSACPDYSNLMFPTGGDTSNTLSEQQETVIHASPLYRGIVEDGGGPALPLQQVQSPGAREVRQERARDGQVTRARSAARAHRAALAGAASWRSGLGKPAASFLGGLWCPDASRRGSAQPADDFHARLARLGGDDMATMLSVATDPGAPIRVRTRALAAVARTAPVDALPRIEALAEDAGTPRALRIAALRAAQQAAPSRGAALALRLHGDADRFVAASARRTRAH
jgi:hypothetical protein